MQISEAKELLESNGYHVEKISDHKRNLLKEMAVDRQFIQNKAESEFNNILCNWCLLKYISESGDKEELQNHWRHELSTAIRNVWKYKLARGNNRDTVYRAIYQQYFEYAEYDSLDLTGFVYTKFIEEHIENADLQSITDQFKKDLEKIINLISYGSSDEIANYVNNI